VTDLINRAEAGLEEARKRGGNEIVSLEIGQDLTGTKKIAGFVGRAVSS